MKIKKILAAVLAAGMIMSFAACGTESESDEKNSGGTSGTNKAANEPSYELVKDGKLIMGTNAEFEPYEYHEGDEIIGIDAEVAALIAEKLGLELEIKDMEFDSIIGAVQARSIDMGMAGMSVTEDRKKSVDFSNTYATAAQVIIVKEESTVTGIDDLKDKVVGVQESTTGDLDVTDELGEDHVKRFSKGSDAVSALKTGTVDAVVIDNQPAKKFVEANEGLKILDAPYEEEQYAIAISKDNTELTAAINKALEELKEDGSIDKIMLKYIPAE